jgi:hypothetical protein
VAEAHLVSRQAGQAIRANAELEGVSSEVLDHALQVGLRLRFLIPATHESIGELLPIGFRAAGSKPAFRTQAPGLVYPGAAPSPPARAPVRLCFRTDRRKSTTGERQATIPGELRELSRGGPAVRADPAPAALSSSIGGFIGVSL